MDLTSLMSQLSFMTEDLFLASVPPPHAVFYVMKSCQTRYLAACNSPIEQEFDLLDKLVNPVSASLSLRNLGLQKYRYY
jgi:hypothetical protein